MAYFCGLLPQLILLQFLYIILSDAFLRRRCISSATSIAISNRARRRRRLKARNARARWWSSTNITVPTTTVNFLHRTCRQWWESTECIHHSSIFICANEQSSFVQPSPSPDASFVQISSTSSVSPVSSVALAPADLRLPETAIDLPLPPQYAPTMLAPRLSSSISNLVAPATATYADITVVTPNLNVPPHYQPIVLRGPNGRAFKAYAMIDNGAQRTIVSSAFATMMGCSTSELANSSTITAANQRSPTMTTDQPVTLWCKSFVANTSLLVLDLPSAIAPTVLLGRDLLQAFGIFQAGVTPNFSTDMLEELGVPQLDRTPRVWDDDSLLPPSLHEKRELLRAKLRERLRDNELRAPANGFIRHPGAIVRVLTKIGAEPANVHQYRCSNKQMQKAIADQIEDWIRDGKVLEWDRPKHGSWALFNMPLLPVVTHNADGTTKKIRVCADARAINRIIVNDESPLPRIPDIYSRLAGKKFYTELDMHQCFLQFMVAEEDRHKLAFTWNNKNYLFAGAPFGLKHLSSHVQRIMSEIFTDMDFCDPFIDNLVIGSDTLEEHFEHVSAVIRRCTELGIRLSYAKCIEKLMCTVLKVLGSVISSHGIRPDPDKIQTVQDWPLPKNQKDLGSFLALANYMRHHVRHFSDLAAPLNAMRGKKSSLEWTDTTRWHFEKLRHAIATCPHLNHPDWSKPFALAVDSSTYGIGACLYQPSVAGELPTADNIVSFASRSLKKFERRYSVYKLELNALVFGLRQFDDYLYGRQFTLLTDHHSLIFLHTQKDLARTLRNWYAAVLEYSFEIVHVPGHLNFVPDVLSRRYTDLWGVTPPLPDQQSFVALVSTGITTSAFRQETRRLLRTPVSFADNASVASFIKEDPPVAMATIVKAQTTTKAAQQVHLDYANLPVAPDPARRSPKTGMKRVQPRMHGALPDIVAPKTEFEQLQLIRKVHADGHFGPRVVHAALAREEMLWPGMAKQIQAVCSECRTCWQWNTGKRIFHPLRPPKAYQPWDSVQIDMITSVDQCDGNSAIFILTDVLTSFTLLRPVRDRSAQSVAAVLLQIVADFGPPRQLQSDGEGSFVSDLVRTLLERFSCAHRTIAAYDPKAAGKVERHVQTVSHTLHKMLQEAGHTHWVSMLPLVQLAVNKKHHSTSNSSPFVLMFNRSMNAFASYADEDALGEPSEADLAAWREQQDFVTSSVFPDVRSHIIKQQNEYVKQFNKRHQVTSKRVELNSIVMLDDKLRASKNEPPFIGPYTVKRVTPLGLYTLVDAAGGIYHRDVTRDQLKVVQTGTTTLAVDSALPVAHYVNRIIDHRHGTSGIEYLLEWSDGTQPTWQLPDDIDDVSTLTRAYFSGLKRLPRQRKPAASSSSAPRKRRANKKNPRRGTTTPRPTFADAPALTTSSGRIRAPNSQLRDYI